MEVNDLIAVLEAGKNLMTVVRSLGLDCLDHREAVRHDKYAELADTITTLRTMVTSESLKMWSEDGAFRAAPSQALKDQLTKAAATPSLITVKVLEGICFGAASVFFANASSVVTLDRGSVVPIPERWLPKIAETPHPATTHPNLLDERCYFILWQLEWVLQLDYTFRDRLDLVCAVRRRDLDKKIGANGGRVRLAYALPKIATVHPFGGKAMVDRPDVMGDGRFFGVHPKLSSPHSSRSATHQQVFQALAKVGDSAPIAVLPEFCLHSPDGLDKLLASSDRPALVVAGSAHTGKRTKKRANTSHVFLDGQLLLSVSKYQPFVVRQEDTQGNPDDYEEDIAPLPSVLRVAAGTATRLAIAICSDLNSSDFLAAMTAACVNLLLSPSWTPRIGVNTGALAHLAVYCQCVGVVANTPGHPFAGKDQTFWACSAVPRESDQVKLHYYPGSPPAVGVLNPNLEPTDPDYWTWVP
jgi:hypothetical protein